MIKDMVKEFDENYAVQCTHDAIAYFQKYVDKETPRYAGCQKEGQAHLDILKRRINRALELSKFFYLITVYLPNFEMITQDFFDADEDYKYDRSYYDYYLKHWSCYTSEKMTEEDFKFFMEVFL